MDEPEIRMNPTLKHRLETISLGLLISVTIGLIITLALFTLYSPATDDVCTTPACIHAASRVLENMDTKVDPCDNFYKFACGRFVKNTIIPDSAKDSDAFTELDLKIQERLRAVIEKPIIPKEPKSFQLAKDLYALCVDTATVESASVPAIHRILKSMGGWPVLEGNKWNNGSFDWIKSTYGFRTRGFSLNYLLQFKVEVDSKNSANSVIYLDEATLGLDREFLSEGLDNKIVKAYLKYMVDVAVILGANRTVAEAELLESLNFEIKLANITLPPEERRDATSMYHSRTIAKLSQKYPSIPWKQYCRKMLNSTEPIQDSDKVIVVIPSYIKQLEQLMKATPKRVQANYMMWRAVKESVSYLSAPVRAQRLPFSRAVDGKKEKLSRWRECIDNVAESFPVTISAIYARNYFHKEAKEKVTRMVNNIKHQFRLILKNADWMDEKTRGKALEKADFIADFVAYPDELLDDSKLYKFDNLSLGTNYLQSSLNIRKYWTDFTFNKLRTSVDAADWMPHLNHAVVNAYYSWNVNSIHLPVGILQGAFFNSDLPKYMNYGGIGFIIGHEITHAFDDNGKQFDKRGNLVDWWELETEKKYLDKAQCIIDQYGNYTVESVGLKIHGVNTQGENIADNGGIKAAYLAYKEWAAHNRTEKMLPGLPYNPQQMFWISAANSWCSVQRPEHLKYYITTNVHSPDEFRIVGSLSNRPEFAEDFKCPASSKMNPAKKCDVW